MPTNKPRCTVTVSDELYEKIEDYRFEHRFYSRSEAALSILKLGLQAIEQMSPEELKEWVEKAKSEGEL